MAEELPVLNQPARPGPTWKKLDWLRALLVLWFVIAWFIGSQRAGVGLEPFFERAWPDASNVEGLSDRVHKALGANGQVLGYAATGSASGYGGPLTVAVGVSPEGQVQSLAVVEHRETPSFFQKVLRERMLRRLLGKTHADQIVLAEDVDGISGATYTVRALTQSVHRAVREVSQDQLKLPVPEDERKIVFGLPEIVLLTLFAVAVIGRKIKRKQVTTYLRWVTLIIGLVFLGFLYNSPFVLAHVNMVLIGYWPEWQTHIFWYILIIGLLLFKAQEEWNVYCYNFCPFGAAQEVLAKIGGAKPRPVRWSALLLWLQRLLVIIAVSLALIYRNPGFSSFEIFGTLFDLSGSNFQFALLAIILLTSLFIHRPFCRYLCPLHKNTLEGLFDNLRRMVKTLWQILRPKPAT